VRLGWRTLAVILVLPLAVELFYLVLPVATSTRMSLNTFGRLSGIHYTVDLGNYRHIISDHYYVRVWGNTARIAAESAAITVGLGAFIAYVLWGVGGRYRAYLTAVILTPLLVSGVVRAYGWIAMTGPTGSLADLTQSIGLGRINLLFHEPAVIIAFIHVFLPFAVLMVLAQLDTIQPSILQAAANLGANAIQVGLRIIMPTIYPVLVSAFLLIFALAMASYAVPAILGGGRVLTIAQVILLEQNASLNWPRAAALGVSLTAFTIVVMLAYQVLLRRLGRRPAVVEV
jgi:putative spermidine/putrescine transport system permease protein